jgi:hypothetical protein
MYVSNTMVRNKGQSIHQKLAAEEQMDSNCFTLSMKGLMVVLREGITIALRGHDTDEPHLFVGGRRFFLHRTHPSLYRPVDGDTGVVRRGEIVLVGPEGNPFRVLCSLYGDVESVLVAINHGVDKTVQLKKEVADLHVWHGVTGTADPICHGPNESLVRFHAEGQVASVMFPDGKVATLIYMDGRLQKLPLTTEEMAKVRIEHAKKQLDIASDAGDVRQWDGVMWGIIKMLHFTKTDHPAREVVVEFLKRNDITDLMRLEIRVRLRELGDQRADSGWFADRGPNREVKTEQTHATVIDKEAKRNAKRAEDAARRLRMKGSGGGGGNSKKGGQKKEGKKGKR